MAGKEEKEVKVVDDVRTKEEKKEIDAKVPSFSLSPVTPRSTPLSMPSVDIQPRVLYPESSPSNFNMELILQRVREEERQKVLEEVRRREEINKAEFRREEERRKEESRLHEDERRRDMQRYSDERKELERRKAEKKQEEENRRGFDKILETVAKNVTEDKNTVVSFVLAARQYLDVIIQDPTKEDERKIEPIRRYFFCSKELTKFANTFTLVGNWGDFMTKVCRHWRIILEDNQLIESLIGMKPKKDFVTWVADIKQLVTCHGMLKNPSPAVAAVALNQFEKFISKEYRSQMIDNEQYMMARKLGWEGFDVMVEVLFKVKEKFGQFSYTPPMLEGVSQPAEEVYVIASKGAPPKGPGSFRDIANLECWRCHRKGHFSYNCIEGRNTRGQNRSSHQQQIQGSPLQPPVQSPVSQSPVQQVQQQQTQQQQQQRGASRQLAKASARINQVVEVTEPERVEESSEEFERESVSSSSEDRKN